MASTQVNVAVIGYGFSAKVFHIPFIRQIPSLNLYGIVQRSPKPDNDASKDFPDAKIWSSTEEMLRDPAVHVVIITTFPSSHFSLTKAALEAGKHVVVEKPWVNSTEEAKELVAIAQKANKTITIYQNRRWDCDFLTVKHLIDSGALGRVIEFESHFDRYRPALPTTASFRDCQATGCCPGNIYDLGTHLIDQAVTLFGTPSSVTAFLNSQRTTETLGGDSFTVLLHYAGGLLVTLKAAVLSADEEQLRFWVRGDKGSFKKYHMDMQEDQLLAKSSYPGQPGFGVDPESHHGKLTQVQDGKATVKSFPTLEPPTYAGFYARLADALLSKGDVPVEPNVAVSVIRLVELAKESSKTGKTVEYSP